MSEEIINVLENLIFDEYEWSLRIYDEQTREEVLEIVEKAIQGILDLYQKEKIKNKVLEDYIIKIRKLSSNHIVWFDGEYYQLKGCGKQDIYKCYDKIQNILKSNYIFLDDKDFLNQIETEGDK